MEEAVSHGRRSRQADKPAAGGAVRHRGSKASAVVMSVLAKLHTAHDSYLASTKAEDSKVAASPLARALHSGPADSTGGAGARKVSGKGKAEAGKSLLEAGSGIGATGTSLATASPAAPVAAPAVCTVCAEVGPDTSCSRLVCSRRYHTECLPELRARSGASTAAGSSGAAPRSSAAALAMAQAQAMAAGGGQDSWICPPCRRELHEALSEADDGGGGGADGLRVGGVDSRMLTLLDIAAGLVRSLGMAHDEACAGCGKGDGGASGGSDIGGAAAAEGTSGGHASSSDDGGAGARPRGARVAAHSSDATRLPAAEDNGPGEVVLCDGPGCTRVYHVGCAPDLAAAGEVPEGDWLCPQCSAGGLADSLGLGLGLGTTSGTAPGAINTAAPSSSDSDSAVGTFGVSPARARPGSQPAASPAASLTAAVSAGDPLVAGAADVVMMPDAPLPSAVAGLLPPGALQRHMDGFLQSPAGLGAEGLREVVMRSAELKDKEECRHPPPYKHITRCLYRIPKPKAPRGSKVRKGRGDEDGIDVQDCCGCAAEGKGCRDDCDNRLLMQEECNAANCSYGADAELQCHNRSLQRRRTKKVVPRPVGGKGWGLFAGEDIAPGEFVMEYVGEILNDTGCEQRIDEYKAAGMHHFYLLEIARDLVIDAGRMGNETRFINHSCSPNTEAHKRHVGDETRICIVACRHIAPGEELTYDYQFAAFGEDRWKCQCGEITCRGYLGANQREADKTEVMAVRVGAGGAAPTPSAGAAAVKLRHHPLDATIYYDADTAKLQPATLWNAHSVESDLAAARAARVFRLGRRQAVPNEFDETSGAAARPQFGAKRKRQAGGAAADVASAASAASARTQENELAELPSPKRSRANVTAAFHPKRAAATAALCMKKRATAGYYRARYRGLVGELVRVSSRPQGCQLQSTVKLTSIILARLPAFACCRHEEPSDCGLSNSTVGPLHGRAWA
jgi:hypothetical protein